MSRSSFRTAFTAILIATLLIVTQSTYSKDYLFATGRLSSTSNTSIDAVNYNSNGTCLVRAFDYNVQLHCKNSSGDFVLAGNFTTKHKIYYATFSSNSSMILAGGSSPGQSPPSMIYLFAYNSSSGKYQYASNLTLNINNELWKVVITTNGSRIVAGSGDGSVSFWNYVNGAYVFQKTFMANSPALYSLTAQSGNFLVTGGRDFILRIWSYDLATNNYVSLQNISCGDEINDIEFSLNEKLIVAGLNKGDVVIWKYNNLTFDQLQTIAYHNGSVMNVRFNAAANRLVVAGKGDSKLTLWVFDSSFNGYLFRSVVAGDVYSVAIDSNNKVIACPYTNPNCTLYTLRLNCTEDPKSNGTNLADSVCACMGAYSWNSSVQDCTLNCVGSPNSMNTSSTFGSCDCVPGFVWNYYFYLCYRNCSDIPSSAGANIDATTCYCGSGYTWRNNSCWLDCSLVADSTGQNTNTTSCECSTGFVWATGAICMRNCQQVQFATGNSKRTDCTCQSDYLWLNNTCALNCLLVANSKGINSGLMSCICNTNFDWRNGSCWLTCAAIPNSPGQNVDSITCTCATGFVWGNGQCWRDCKTISYSTGVNVDSSRCICLLGFVWNTTDNQCWRNCSLALNSTGATTYQDSCVCTNGFAWNSKAEQCYLNCSSIANTVGGNLDRLTCGCGLGYEWSQNVCRQSCSFQPTNDANYNYQVCQCNTGYTRQLDGCWKDCTLIKNSTGKNLQKTVCGCQGIYAWYYTDCFVDCTKDPFSSGRNLTRDTCECRGGFKWTGTKCVRDCSLVNHSTSINLKDDQCECTPLYMWSEFQCIRNCSIIGSTGKNLNSQMCECLSQFDWINGECEINCNKTLQTFNKTLLSETHTGLHATAYACSCPPGYHWNDTSFYCYLDCRNNINSTGSNNDKDSCIPKAGYVWVGREILKNCNTIDRAVGRSTEDRYSCACESNFEWVAKSESCQMVKWLIGVLSALPVVLVVVLVVTGKYIRRFLKRYYVMGMKHPVIYFPAPSNVTQAVENEADQKGEQLPEVVPPAAEIQLDTQLSKADIIAQQPVVVQTQSKQQRTSEEEQGVSGGAPQQSRIHEQPSAMPLQIWPQNQIIGQPSEQFIYPNGQY